jgi:hypothetical protein
MPSLTGIFGQFVIQNLTTGMYTWVDTPCGNTNVGGSEAEWIVERRPSSKTARTRGTMTSRTTDRVRSRPRMRTTGNQYVGYSDANNNQIDMVNGQGNLLSTVTPVDASTMNFEWHAFH